MQELVCASFPELNHKGIKLWRAAPSRRVVRPGGCCRHTSKCGFWSYAFSWGQIPLCTQATHHECRCIHCRHCDSQVWTCSHCTYELVVRGIRVPGPHPLGLPRALGRAATPSAPSLSPRFVAAYLAPPRSARVTGGCRYSLPAIAQALCHQTTRRRCANCRLQQPMQACSVC